MHLLRSLFFFGLLGLSIHGCSSTESGSGSTSAAQSAPPAASGSASAGQKAPPRADGKRRPNIVYVMSDDQRAESISCMPKLRELMGPNAISFVEHFSSTPLCCPARSSVLTGLYAHNHGVLANADIEEDDREERTNGALDFKKNGNEAKAFVAWLKTAGYATGLFGKYLNDYDAQLAQDAQYVPPHWDEWRAFVQAKFYDFELQERGLGESKSKRRCYASDVKTRKKQEQKCKKTSDEVVDDGNENYSTDVLRDRAIAFMKKSKAQGSPFFVFFAPWSPHSPYTSPARYQPDPFEARFTDEAMKRLGDCPLFEWKDRPASFLEEDVSDKPDWIQAAAKKKHKRDKLDDLRKQQLVSVLATEDAMAAFFDVLKELGELENTVVVYHGDNGYSWGDHHHPAKNCTYEGCAKIPLLIRDPAVTSPRPPIEALTMNIDLTPTFASWAGVLPAMPKVDGLDMLPFIRGETKDWPRKDVLIECWGTGKKGHADVQTSVRDARWKYVEHYDDPQRTQVHQHSKGGPDVELYDLDKDPHELDNLLRLDAAGLARTGHTKDEVEKQRAEMEKRLKVMSKE